jgi:hypothetical protein
MGGMGRLGVPQPSFHPPLTMRPKYAYMTQLLTWNGPMYSYNTSLILSSSLLCVKELTQMCDVWKDKEL